MTTAAATATFVQFELGSVAFVMEKTGEGDGPFGQPLAQYSLPGATTVDAALQRLASMGWRAVGHPELVDLDGQYVVDVEPLTFSQYEKVVTVHDNGSTFTVTISDAHGERLSLSTPSGRLSGYPEARRRELDRRVADVRDFVADLLARGYRDATVVGLDELADADPESIARTRS